jgi:fatty-acyl-CoA synthase
MTGELKSTPPMIAGAVPTVGELFRSCAQVHSASTAIEYQGRQISYGQLLDRVQRVTAMLASYGLRRGDRVALLSHNRPEYLEVELAAANLGVMTACLNWRLSQRELAYCIELVSPKLVIVEEGFAGNLESPAVESRAVIAIGSHYERLLQQQSARPEPILADSEDGLVILYTSGTTGLPKGAVISHRAMVMRALVFSSELSISHRDSFVAWAPMFHMASTDHSLATLLRGGTVVMIDGFQVEPLLAVEQHHIGWLVLIPVWWKRLPLRSRRRQPR